MGPLPRYEPLGVRVGQVQPISTVGQEQAARTAMTLADNLNRMSSFAFEQAAAQARIEGAEYGAANVPTLEQVKRGQEIGQDVMPGNTSSVFGRAARASALEQMKQNIEIEARSKLSEFDATARRSDMPLDEYRKQMDQIVVGYSSAMSQISPATAGSVRAALTVLTSSSYSAHAKHLYDKAQAREKIMIGQGIDGIIQGVDKIVQNGGRHEGSPGDEVFYPTESVLAAERNNILRLAYRLGDPELAKSKIKEFNEQVKTALRGSVVNWTLGEDGSPAMAKYNQVMTGKLDDPKVQQVWDGLSSEDRVKTQDEVRRQIKAKLELNASVEAEQNRQRVEAVQNNRVSFVKAYEKGDAAAMQAALDSMDELRDAEGREKYGAVVSEKRSHTEAGLLVVLEDELTRGKLNNERIFSLVKDKRLSDTDARTLIGKIETASNREFSEAMEYVKRELGFPDRSIINPSAIDRKAIQAVNKINNAMIAARRRADAEGKPFSPYDFAELQIADAKRTQISDIDITRAEQKARGLAKDLGLPPETPFSQIRQELARRTTLDPKDKGYRNPKTQQDFFDALKLLIDNGAQ